MPSKYLFYTEDQLYEEQKRFDALKYPTLTTGDREAMMDMSATFWYHDISLSGGKYCFNNNLASPYDYHCYFDLVKELSRYKISQLLPGRADDRYLKSHNFHIVDRVNSNLRAVLEQLFDLKQGLSTGDAPLIYQIGLYNSDKCREPIPEGVKLEDHKKKAPRVFFRLTNRGAFSIFILDLYHELYPEKDRSSK